MPKGPARWQVVVPLKTLPAAKSRLTIAPPVRLRLARAFALDVIDACQASARVASVMAIADDSWVGLLGGAGRHADPGGGLNPAVRSALAAIPGDRPTAVMVGDLPCLTSAAVTGLLDRAEALIDRHPMLFVPDAAGTGTTILLGRARNLQPEFGGASAAAHTRAGAVRLNDLPWTDLRVDVDDEASLIAARSFGVGRHTAAALSWQVSTGVTGGQDDAGPAQPDGPRI